VPFVPITPAESIAATLRSELEPCPSGTRVMSTRKLAERFNVAPATAAKVLRILKAEGLVVTRQGFGTFRA
jgi:DNA-binding GntR family transcriptional regulator